MRRKLDSLISKIDFHKSQLEAARLELERLKTEEMNALEAQKRLQKVAESVQAEAHSGLASVVTGSLKSVFGAGCYDLKIHFEQRRGKTEARLALHDSQGRDIGDPLESTGHGYVDICAFALRMAGMVLKTPKVRRLFVADEPFRAVSKGYRPRVRRMIEELASELGVQVILVTHDPELVCGNVFDLKDE